MMRCFFQVEFRAVHKGKLLFKGSRLDMKGALASSKLVRVESEMSPRGSRLGIGASETTRYGKIIFNDQQCSLGCWGSRQVILIQGRGRVNVMVLWITF